MNENQVETMSKKMLEMLEMLDLKEVTYRKHIDNYDETHKLLNIIKEVNLCAYCIRVTHLDDGYEITLTLFGGDDEDESK